MMRDKQLKEVFEVGFPTRTEPGEARRAKIENACICRAALRKGRVLQRALYIYPGANAEEAKRCRRGSAYLRTVILKLVERRTMVPSLRRRTMTQRS